MYLNGMRNSIIEWQDNNRFSSRLKPVEISNLEANEQEKLITEFCDEVLNREWIPLSYDNEDLQADWRLLQIIDYKNHCVENGFKSNISGSLPIPGKKIILTYQPHFFSIASKAKSIASAWSDAKIVNKAGRALLTTGGTISLERFIRELQFAGAYKASMFAPSFAAAIINKLVPEAKTWFDPCGGWGNRLLAAKLLNVEYEACEPQHDTYAGLCAINKIIDANAKLHETIIEDFEIQRRYDVAFTSPPFFNTEKYGVEIKQQSYKEWIAGFLSPIIDKLLKIAKKVLLHISDKIKLDLEKLYDIIPYPSNNRRNPHNNRGTEWIVEIKNNKVTQLLL